MVDVVTRVVVAVDHMLVVLVDYKSKKVNECSD